MPDSERVRVGDVLELRRTAVEIDPLEEYTLIGVYSFGKGIFHRQSTLGADLGDYRFFEVHPGDLVLSNIQAWEGAIAWANDEDQNTVGTHRFLTYVAKDERIDTSWARYFFLSEPGFALVQQAAPGTVKRNRTLAIDRFENLVIPLPHIDEQHRVARRLDSLLSQWSGAAAATRGFARTIGGVHASWLGRAMQGWPLVERLGEAAAVYRGHGPRYEPGSGRMVVNQACVRADALDLTACREAEPSWWDGVPAHLRVRSKDVLVNSTGEGTIGRSTVAPDDAVGLPFDSHVLVARVDTERLLPLFLDAFLTSPAGQEAIEALKSANTTKQTELGKQKLERLQIPMPSLKEQEALVHDIQRIQDRIARTRQSVVSRDALVRALPTSLLNRAFAGLM